MLDNLLRFKPKQKYLTFDTETESVNNYLSRPWQLSYLISEGEKAIKTVDKFILWDDISVSAGAVQATDFNYAAYKAKAEPAGPILEEFEAYLYDPSYRVLGQNIIGFDTYQHNVWRRHMGKKPDFSWMPRALDTFALGKAIHLGSKPAEDLLAWQYQLLNERIKGIKLKLINQCQAHDIPFDEEEAHDACYDVKKTHELFHKQKFLIDI